MVMNKVRLGSFIQSANEPNKQMLLNRKEDVLGISIDKEFMPSVANLNGTDLSKYYILRKNRFAYNPMHVGRDERLPISLYRKDNPALVSSAYEVFEVKDDAPVILDYLMLIFKTELFDKLCWRLTDGSVRGGLSYADFLNIEIYIPSIEEQQKVVNQYNTIVNRIDVLERLNEKLEELIQVIFSSNFKPLSAGIQSNLTLDDFVVYSNGNAFKSEDYQETGIYKIITIKNVNDGYVDVKNVDYISEIDETIKNKYLLSIGDIVMSLTGNVGRTALVPTSNLLLNQRVAKYTPIHETHKGFIYALFRNSQSKSFIESIAKGTAQLNLSPVELGKVGVDFDKEKIEKLSNKFNACLNSLINNTNEIIKLKELKNVLISKIA